MGTEIKETYLEQADPVLKKLRLAVSLNLGTKFNTTGSTLITIVILGGR